MSVNYAKRANKSGQCKAKVKVLNGAIIANTSEHTRAPVVGRAEVFHIRISNKQFILYTIVFLYLWHGRQGGIVKRGNDLGGKSLGGNGHGGNALESSNYSIYYKIGILFIELYTEGKLMRWKIISVYFNNALKKVFN